MKDSKYQLIFQHGWGLDRKCWESWESVLPGKMDKIYLDRGYFKTPRSEPDQESDREIVLIAYSYGIHLVPEELLEKADKLVVISGFDSFHGDDTKKARNSKRIVNLMIKRLRQMPELLLRDFYQSADIDVSGEKSESIDLGLLESDLAELNENRLNSDVLNNISDVLIIHGGKDRVVPLERAEALHGNIPGSRLVVFDDADHSLPFTHTEQCWEAVKSECLE